MKKPDSFMKRHDFQHLWLTLLCPYYRSENRPQTGVMVTVGLFMNVVLPYVSCVIKACEAETEGLIGTGRISLCRRSDLRISEEGH